MSCSFTLDEYAVMWLEEASTRTKPQTVRRYRYSYQRHISPELGAELLSEVTRFQVKRLVVQSIRDGTGSGSVAMMIRVLSMLFASAYDEGLVARHPAMRLRRLFQQSTGEGAPPKAFTGSELARFLSASKAEPLYDGLFRVMALSGIRHGEARALQVGDLELAVCRVRVERTFAGSGELSISPKSESSRRRVEIPRGLASELAGFVRWRKPGEWLFHRKGEPLSECSSRIAFRRIARRAKLPVRFTPHSLRHTYASLLIQRGFPAEYVQRQLGHRSIQMTVDVYGKWLELSKARELDRLMDSLQDEGPMNTPAKAPPLPRFAVLDFARVGIPDCSPSEVDNTDDEEPA